MKVVLSALDEYTMGSELGLESTSIHASAKKITLLWA